jgi:hypothetical protein
MSVRDASVLFISSSYFAYLEHSWFVSFLRQNIVTDRERFLLDSKFESLKIIFETSWIQSNVGLAREIHFKCLSIQEDLRLLTLKYQYSVFREA